MRRKGNRKFQQKSVDFADFFEQKIGVTDKERLLLRQYISASPDPAEIKKLFSMVHYEEETFAFSYMLSRLCAQHGFHWAPAMLQPRIRGCYRQIAVGNISRLNIMFKMAGQLASRGIPILVIKGGALRLGALANIPRQMGDVDIVVPKAHFEEAKKIALDCGFTIKTDSVHSVDLLWEGRNCLDLHYTFFKHNIWKSEIETIWEQAKKITQNGTELLLPPLEDLFLHILINAFDNIIFNEHHKGSISWAADCFDLLKRYPELSLKRVLSLSKEYDVVPQLKMMALILDRLIPNHFKELLQVDESPLAHRIYSRFYRFDRYLSVSYKDTLTYPLLKRIFFRIGFTYFYSTSSQNLLSKSTWSCLQHYPAFLKNYWGIYSFGSLYSKIKEKISQWNSQKSL